MKYLIAQDWINTSNNHAGIKYLCNQMQSMYPSEFRALIIPSLESSNEKYNNLIINKIRFYKRKIKHFFYVKSIAKYLAENLKDGDSVYLMEYMDKTFSLKKLAFELKKNFPHVKICAMAHLVPAKFDHFFMSDEEFLYWLKPIDRVITLGHSLTDYFIKRGCAREKLFTTFHYVDSYYFNDTPCRNHKKITVIAMGNQMRNVVLLKKIVDANPNVDFVICQGICDMSSSFKNNDNVKLIPFVTEDELRYYMLNSDISLNVMEDTIGSNVIVTSLAMGLAMICSDVGSIHDYCDSSNAIFCHNSDIDAFSSAISQLSTNPHLLRTMQLSSAEKAKRLSIESFVQELNLNIRF